MSIMPRHYLFVLLRNPLIPMPSSPTTLLPRWLAWLAPQRDAFPYRVHGAKHMRDLPRPFGWRWSHELGRDAYVLMPLWLYAISRLWLHRWFLHRVGARTGFLDVQPNLYYAEGHWTWRWGSSLTKRAGRALPSLAGTRWDKWRRAGLAFERFCAWTQEPVE